MSSTRLLATLAAAALAAGLLIPTAAAPAAAQSQTPPVDTDTNTWQYSTGESYDDGLQGVRDLDMCRDEAIANADHDDEAWSGWTEAYDGFLYTRTRTKTVVDGDCTIVYTHSEIALTAGFLDPQHDTLTFTVTGPVLDETVEFPDCAATPCPNRAGSLAEPRPCRTEAQAVIDNGDPPDATTTEDIRSRRVVTHTWVRGVCTITQILFHSLVSDPPTLTHMRVRHVFEIPEPTGTTVSAQGSRYAKLLFDLAARIAECGTEATANGSRSRGEWGYSNPSLSERGRNSRRVVTKIVTVGQCQITYEIAQEYTGNRWVLRGLTLSYMEFATAPPRTPPPPEGPGGKRDDCLPAVAGHFPHLCNTTVPDTKLVQCPAGSAAERPDLCDGATIVTERTPPPGPLRGRMARAGAPQSREQETARRRMRREPQRAVPALSLRGMGPPAQRMTDIGAFVYAGKRSDPDA